MNKSESSNNSELISYLNNLLETNISQYTSKSANVLNETYGLKRPFNYMTRATADYSSTEVEAIVEALVAYMGTKEGKAIIMENGGIVESTLSDQNWNDIKTDYSKWIAISKLKKV